MASKKKKIAKRLEQNRSIKGILTSIDNAIKDETTFPIIRRRLEKIRAKVREIQGDQIAIDCYCDGRIV